MNTAIGKSVQRKDAWDKVTGKAKYTDDYPTTGVLSARLLTSTYAHARIVKLDISQALALEGVKAVITGADCPELFGPLVLDRPALARDVVRYAGEPVAMVVANQDYIAEQAVRLIKVEYESLTFVLTPSQALATDAPLLHNPTNGYKKVMTDIYPDQHSNIASRYEIKKGNVQEGFAKCNFIAEKRFYLPPSDHLAMEVRTARAEISSDGMVEILSATQSPYSVRKQLSECFVIPSGQIQVRVPYIGGGFGGKAPVTLEILAYIASRSVGGKAVRVTIPREQDMASMPCRMGLEANVKIGADAQGIIQAAEIIFWLDCGAYADIAPYMAKAMATDCTGPYHIKNVYCNAMCVYTNHTYVTSYRGFAHESANFCVERVLDMLAERCGMDPLLFRAKNAIKPGCDTPTQVKCTEGLVGNLVKCIDEVKTLSQWDGGKITQVKPNVVRVKGVSCFWKTENPPIDAISGALVTLNPDGTLNLNTGVVEMGSNGQTHLAQILAEKLKMQTDQIHIVSDVDTKVAPEHWKTVASLTEYMAGYAVMRAADDIIAQLQKNGSLALQCPIEDIEVAYGRVYSKKNPENFIAFKDIVQGYLSKSGESLGEPVIGRGGFILKGLSLLDPHTGKGRTGPDWTLGAQVVEIEADLKKFTYRILNASTAIDVGNVINHESMRAMVAGGMAMGMSMSSREGFAYDENGVPKRPNLRTYKLMHIGQEPDYRVSFVETPNPNSPYGVRSYSEHGILGIPAALANALSKAFGVELTTLPITPELIWKAAKEGGKL